MKKYLLAGLLVWTPLAITVWVLTWVLGAMDGLFAWLLSAPQALLPASAHESIEKLRHVPGMGVLVLALGLLLTGVFEIGDTLTQKSSVEFEGIPSFAPEHFVRVLNTDPMRRKQLKAGLDQLAQEGTIQLYRPPEGLPGEPILGAVGRLQLEVVKSRLENEYDVSVRLEPITCEFARWVSRSDGQPVDLRAFDRERIGIPAVDVRDRGVVLFAGEWQLNSAKREFPGVEYHDTARAAGH